MVSLWKRWCICSVRILIVFCFTACLTCVDSMVGESFRNPLEEAKKFLHMIFFSFLLSYFWVLVIEKLAPETIWNILASDLVEKKNNHANNFVVYNMQVVEVRADAQLQAVQLLNYSLRLIKIWNIDNDIFHLTVTQVQT